jgi:hypothetical protein
VPVPLGSDVESFAIGGRRRREIEVVIDELAPGEDERRNLCIVKGVFTLER